MKHNEKVTRSLQTLIQTFYIITKSDHITILYPATYFTFVSALAGPVLITGNAPPLASILISALKSFL